MVRKTFIFFCLMMCIVFNGFAQDASFLLKYAEKGDKEAMFNLAQCYIDGTGGVGQDYNQATMWLTKAAKKNYAPAQYKLGLCYMYGAGVLKDYFQAWQLIQKAVKQNYPAAVYTTACCYRDGTYVQQDEQLWLNWLNKAAQLEDDDALADLGYVYLYGDDKLNILQDFDKAINLLRKGAELNNSKANFCLDICYQFGAGVTEDKEKALQYYYTAAQAGHADAQCEVAEAYLRGINGVDQNFSEAHKYINAAAQQESPRAYKLLADIYYYGLGVDEDNEKAAEWYKKAVDAGNLDAISQLAYMYLYGIGVGENEPKAFQLYKQAADSELSSGYSGLGKCYENGYGCTKSIPTAVTYYKKAADKNNNYSLHRLYFIYKDGEGVTKDTQAAIQYLRQAADNGYNSALYSLGYEYLTGEILHQENSSALEYITKAADGGYSFACAVLGTFYYDGEPLVEKDFNKAFKYLSEAVRDAQSINEGLLSTVYKDLGACYRFGRRTEVDQSMASYYTEQAAKLGDKSSLESVKLPRNKDVK